MSYNQPPPSRSIAEMTTELRAKRPGIVIKYWTRRCTDPKLPEWEARVKAGFANGAFPVWSARGQTSEDAVHRALHHAHHYWCIAPSGQ